MKDTYLLRKIEGEWVVITSITKWIVMRGTKKECLDLIKEYRGD